MLPQSPLPPRNLSNSKWYAFIYDKINVLEYQINDTAFVRNNLDWSFQAVPGAKAGKVLQLVRRNGNVYYLVREQENPNGTITLHTLAAHKPGISFVHVMPSEQTADFATEDAALQYIKTDTVRRPGLICYSEKETVRLKALPSVSKITAAHYKTYLQGIQKANTVYNNYIKGKTDAFQFMFVYLYMNNQARALMAGLGYNPVISGTEFEAMVKKMEQPAAGSAASGKGPKAH